MNAKEIDPIPEEFQELVNGHPIYIHNAGPYRWQIALGTMGEYTLLPPVNGEAVGPVVKIPYVVFETYATDMNKMAQRPWSGKKLAEDIVGIGPFKAAQQDLTRWGVFISSNEEPAKKEIEAARAKLKSRWVELVKEGDDLQAQGPMQIQNISAEHRRAAQELNLERDWSKMPTEMLNCPGCGEKVVPGIIMHAGRNGCGYVFDEKKAIAAGMIAAPEK